jgi:DNA-binding SARP family transcriptional activator
MSGEHPIFQAVLNGQYGLGLDLYRNLGQPSPADDRWAGYCLYLSGQLLEAKDLLVRARGRGCAEAGLELITVLRGLGDVNGARAILADLPTGGFSPTERAYALRESAALHLADGQLRAARAELERAWTLLGAPDGATDALRIQTAQLLGYTYHRLGRTVPATHYLDLALDPAQGGGQGMKRAYPLLTRAQVHLYSGRYGRCQQDLYEVEGLLIAVPAATATFRYVSGLLARAQGQWSTAQAQFQGAATSAKATGDESTEFLAELGLASILTVQNDLQGAETCLRRAASLVQTEWEQAMLNLREGAWLHRRGQAGAAVSLQRAAQSFVSLGLPREAAWAELHLAAHHLDRSESATLAALCRVGQNRDALDSGAPLLPELRLLPGLTAQLGRYSARPEVAQLLTDRREVLGDAPLRLRLVTLGDMRLEVDGAELRLGMRRTPEVLAFLLLRGQASRSEMLSALWADEEPTRARNYFHQVVHALKETLPYLRIEYRRKTRQYTLVCEGPLLEWDAADIKRLLSSPDENERQRAILEYSGFFLPEVESEWAREERDALTFSVIGVGLKLMSQWSAAGEYQKCISLARRLLDVDPCDESLAEYFVLATYELEGRVAAQRALVEVGVRAERELSTPPDWLARLTGQIQPVLN